MKTRLVLLLAPVLFALSGCATDQALPIGSLADGTFQQEIGKPLPIRLPSADCPVQ